LRMIAVWVLVTTPAYIVFDTLRSLLNWLLNLKPMIVAENAATPARGFDVVPLLHLLVLDYPMSIVLGALCVGILSYTYKALAGLPPDAVLNPKG
jgi:hypothetical protein